MKRKYIRNILNSFLVLLVAVLLFGCTKEVKHKYLNELIDDTTMINNIVLNSGDNVYCLSDDERLYVCDVLNSIISCEIVTSKNIDVKPVLESTLSNGLGFSLYNLDNSLYCKIGLTYYELISDDTNCVEITNNFSYYFLNSVNEKILFDYNLKYNKSDLKTVIVGAINSLLVCAINDNKSMDLVINDVKFSSVNSYHIYTYDVKTRVISPLEQSSLSKKDLLTVKNNFYFEVLKENIDYSNGINYLGAYNSNDNLVIVYGLNENSKTILGDLEFDTCLYGYYDNKVTKLEDLYNSGVFDSSDASLLYDYANKSIVTLKEQYSDLNNVDKNSIEEIIVYSSRLDGIYKNVYYYTNKINEILTLFEEILSKPLLNKEMEETGFSKSLMIVTDSSNIVIPLSVLIDNMYFEFELDRVENIDAIMFEESTTKVLSDESEAIISLENILLTSYTPSVHNLTEQLVFSSKLLGQTNTFSIIDENHIRCEGSYYEVVGKNNFSEVMNLKVKEQVTLTLQDKEMKICDIIYDKGSRVNITDIINYLKYFGYKYSYRSFYFDVYLKDEATIFTLNENDTIFIGPITLPWI